MSTKQSAPEITAAEAAGWVDYGLDDIDGAGIGKVSGCFIDAESGKPADVQAKRRQSSCAARSR